jgi:hypothetical protein
MKTDDIQLSQYTEGKQSGEVFFIESAQAIQAIRKKSILPLWEKREGIDISGAP